MSILGNSVNCHFKDRQYLYCLFKICKIYNIKIFTFITNFIDLLVAIKNLYGNLINLLMLF